MSSHCFSARSSIEKLFLLPLRCSLHRGDLLVFITVRWKKSLIASNHEFNSSSGLQKTRLALSFRSRTATTNERIEAKRKEIFPRKTGKNVITICFASLCFFSFHFSFSFFSPFYFWLCRPKEILKHLKMFSLNQIHKGHVLSKQSK